MSTDDTWTISLTFKADGADSAALLRELLQSMAENYRGITDVDVEATHPDRFAWVNLSGRPGDGRLIDLELDEVETTVRAAGGVL